ncbi:PAS domain S-box protein, partial [Fulvivirga sp. RKSG066]|uniref:PAS domain-containing protein n=1 Tax=Fulvivirga aurantia TaxID=2529383 RepID=UPI0012BC8B30
MSNSEVFLDENILKLINLSNEYACAIDQDLTILAINDTFKNDIPDYSVKKVFADLLQESDQQDIKELIKNCLSTGKRQKFVADLNLAGQNKIEWRLETNNQKDLIFCFGTVLKRHHEQERNRLIEALDQISLSLSKKEGRLSEGEITDIQTVLSEKVDKFKLISQNVSDIVCLHEPNEARYLYVSPSLTDVTGYEPREFEGKSPYDFFHPDMHKMLEDDHKKKQQGEDQSDEGPPPKMLYKIQSKDGGYIWLESHSKPIFDDDGNVIMILSTSRDVTERVDAEEEKEKFFEYYRILGNN